MQKNIYKCDPEQWDKFNEAGKKAYNDVMKQSLSKMELFIPQDYYLTNFPCESRISVIQGWKAICHNFACAAAWSAMEDVKELVEVHY